MEVHPPHGSLHSWKDFWIHLGTISIGLLIAISLEQSVEWVHRMHERHVLQEDLRQEALGNRELVETDLKAEALTLRWINDLTQDIAAIRASHSKLKLPGRPDYLMNGTEYKYLYLNPTDAVWTTARDGGTLALLPRGDAQVYARLYRLLNLVHDQWWVDSQDVEGVYAFSRKFGSQARNGPNLGGMNDAELARFQDLLDSWYVSESRVTDLLRYFSGTNEAILGGARTEAEVQKAMYAASARGRDRGRR